MKALVIYRWLARGAKWLIVADKDKNKEPAIFAA